MSMRAVALTVAAGLAVGGTAVGMLKARKPPVDRKVRVVLGHTRRPAEQHRVSRTAPMPATSDAGWQQMSRTGAGAEARAFAAHAEMEQLFLSRESFGYSRIQEEYEESTNQFWRSRDIQRAELVSLLVRATPSVYVLESMPSAATSAFAERRNLDAFETAGLQALREGAEGVVSTADAQRFLAPIRAREECLGCHQGYRTGDVLGAFTYYLKKPVQETEPTLAAVGPK